MASYLTPGVYVEEKKSAIQPIEGVSTSVAAFIGVTLKGPVNKATLITSLAEFVSVFGGAIPIVSDQERYLYYAVRHFFVEGGTKCYVVRVTGYGDVNNTASLQAKSASKNFNGLAIDGTTAVPNALTVSALTPGKWGEVLKVQVENASKFSLLLAEDVTASPTLTQLTLKDNQDVQVGSMLYVTEQVTGQVKSVDNTEKTITFEPHVTAESGLFDYIIPNDAKVFSPDMKFDSKTDLNDPKLVKKVGTKVTIKLKSLLKNDEAGNPMKAGDLVNIANVIFPVEQVSGEVISVDTNSSSIKFKPTPSSEYTIQNDVTVFSPDIKTEFESKTDLLAPVIVKAADTEVTIKLKSLQKKDEAGNSIEWKAGDPVNIILSTRTSSAPKMVVVKRFVEKISSGETAMLVEFKPTNLADFDKTHTKLYALDFDVLVKEGDVLAEAHRHLSLISSNRRDYVNDRLGTDGGVSRLITVSGNVSPNSAVAVFTAFGNLGGADDGLAGSHAFGDDDIIGSELTSTGLYALDTVKDVSILVIPNAPNVVAKAAIAYCEKRKDLFYVMDLPKNLSDPMKTAKDAVDYLSDPKNVTNSSYAAVYYPWIVDDDPLTGNPITLPPSGAVAGIYAQTDVTRGVHKAPAGVGNGYVRSATGIQKIITKAENDILYQNKINVIRKYPEGILVWGARTLSAEPAWRYINVRRLFIFLEQSIERGLQWAVFEPNNFPLWKSIKRNVSAFLRVQWEEGKLVGNTEDKAFFVRCDEVTNTPDTVNVGQVIAEIGVAPSKPAEFVVFRFKQFVGKTK